MSKQRGYRQSLQRIVKDLSRELIYLAGEYRDRREKLGEFLATYQRLYGSTADLSLPRELHDAMAMGRAPSLRLARRKNPSNAVRAAIALTEAGEVMVPMPMRAILGLLIASGLAGDSEPTLATLQSTVIRSGLFESIGGGLWRLIQPVTRGDIGGRQLTLEVEEEED
jgi:hypothetical protein